MTKTRKRPPHGLLIGHDKYVCGWVADHSPGGDGVHGLTATAIGVLSGERLIAGVVYHDYYPEHKTMQLGIASISPMWAQKGTIRQLLSYPFEQLKVYKAWTVTESTHKNTLKAVGHIGFSFDAKLKHHFGEGRHGTIMRLLRPDFYRLYGGEEK